MNARFAQIRAETLKSSIRPYAKELKGEDKWKRPILALIMAAGILAAKPASALTDYYMIHGNNCTSITNGLTPVYNQLGPSARGASGINVSCPIILPSNNYTYAWMMVVGHNRNSVNKLSCTIGSTESGGTNSMQATAKLDSNVPATAEIYPPASSYLYIKCYLPAVTASGISYLSNIVLGVQY